MREISWDEIMSQSGAFPVELGREYELKLGRSFSTMSKSVVHTFECESSCVFVLLLPVQPEMYLTFVCSFVRRL